MARKSNKSVNVVAAPAQVSAAEVAVLEGLAQELAANPALAEAYDAALAQEPTEELPAPVIGKTAPKAIAREHNFGIAKVAADAVPAPAPVVKPAKGTNLSKERVYGYDNGEGNGKVPVKAKIAIVPDAKSPAGVTPNQWLLLQEYAGKTVEDAYANRVASRSVRRAFRAGAIRFVAA